MSRGKDIRLFEDDRGWAAVDRSAGARSLGATRQEALANLDEVVELVESRTDDDGVAIRPPDVP